jgi:predicted nuclease of predicted toxin-antitoxin system
MPVAHAAGFEAMHVNHLGLSGKPDWELAERLAEDEFAFVTNHVDFIRLFSKMELHAGLIVIVPDVVPSVQRAMFQAAILYIGKDLVNSAIEVSLEGNAVKCVGYPLPEEWVSMLLAGAVGVSPAQSRARAPQ